MEGEKLRRRLRLLMRLHKLRRLGSIYDINLCDQFFFETSFRLTSLRFFV